ncbi:hypothetical protein [Cardinium endosymbiont of Bemisia tabaci]|uniref:hypothetical protein n=1 Tax=Cardinium endosymbiont of Bemisia tabaci TaxID=672794 RepID=UPI000442D25F|nr:hypothetical protein [Cardinium endosymbiont of Bemisia tabaci]CDG49371.1 Hypothetical protein CHV_a0043 [Cardinium endosymbiont cBtQ1 of Bemisia tabaci]
MEWKFVLLRQIQLRLSVLPIAISIGCKRDAPRYEPGPIAPIEKRKLFNRAQNNIKGPGQLIPNGYRLFRDLSDEINDNVKVILKDISWSDLLSVQFQNSKKPTILSMSSPTGSYAQNDFSSFIEAHLLDRGKTASSAPLHESTSRLVIVFNNNQQHNGCDKHRLAGTESITLRSNAGNSEKHTYALIGFLVPIPKHSNVPKEHFIPFVQSGKKWYYDNNGSRDLIDTQKTIRLASERATIFFYQKST